MTAPCPRVSAMQTTPAQQLDNKRLIARDRLLLYTRGMDIDLEDGVALALESMRRAGKDAGPDTVMEELFGILRERGHSPVIPGANGLPLASAPPMNRKTVLPNNMEPLSLTAAFRKWAWALTARITGKREASHER